MARQRAAVGKNHCPRNIARPAEQLAVDEIADAAEPEPNGHGHHVEVGGLPEAEAMVAAVQQAGDDDAQAPPVKGHAALPGGENLQGVAQVVGRLIEQDVAEPAAGDDTDDQVEVEVVEPFGHLPPAKAGELAADQKVGGGEA